MQSILAFFRGNKGTPHEGEAGKEGVASPTCKSDQSIRSSKTERPWWSKEEGSDSSESDDSIASMTERPWWCKVESALSEIEDLMRRVDAVVAQNQQTLVALTRDVERLKRQGRRNERAIKESEGVMRVLENVFCT
eukprot:jgi/Mesvir1/759/Mv17360-RA.1